MQNIALLVAVLTLASPGYARKPQAVIATNPEKETAFTDLAECRQALAAPRKTNPTAVAGGPSEGSLFNRAQGNISRCELVDGEALIVVYPRASAISD